MHIASAERALIAKFPREIPSSRYSPLRIREIRANYPGPVPLSAVRSRDSRTRRGIAKGWLTPFSESAVRTVVTSRLARAAAAGNGGNGKGGTTSGGESQSIPQRATEGMGRGQGGRGREDEVHSRERDA